MPIVKLCSEEVEPPVVVRSTFPPVVPGITIAVSCVSLLDIIIAELPPIVSFEALLNPVPVIVTIVPAMPFVGSILEITGDCAKRIFPAKRRKKIRRRFFVPIEVQIKR